MGIDKMGVDELGVDEMGSRRSGTTPFCRSAHLFCYPNRKTYHINCIMLCVL